MLLVEITEIALAKLTYEMHAMQRHERQRKNLSGSSKAALPAEVYRQIKSAA